MPGNPSECPHCADGNKARIRPETGELVHDLVNVALRRYGQTICWNDPKWKEMKAKDGKS